MLISVHDKTLSRVTFLDNEKPNTLHYFNETWHRYLIEATSTFDFSVPKTGHPDTLFLNEKGYVSFQYGGKDYLFNIMKVEETETSLTCYCENLNLELLNETSPEYKAPVAKTFVQYLTLLELQYAQLEMGINEVSDLSRTLEWTGQDTKLARLLSLVNKFDAECEFVTHLNRDGTLANIVLNVYRKHDGNYQGVGTRRNDLTLYYGKEIKEIHRTVDKTGLYTAIKPIGTDGLTIEALDKTVLDADGNVLFRSPSGDTHIYCPSMRDEYPSQIVDPTGDRYINLDWMYETNNVNILYGQALAKLKAIYTPAITYEVDGFMDLDIGDTVKMHDSGFTPLLLLEARVSEQEISFTQPDKNKTTFANFRALENKLSASIQSRLEALIRDSIPYVADILTTDGLIFRNGGGSTTLTARVSRGTAVVTNQLSIQWYKDGVTVSTNESITVQAAGISEKAVYRFVAMDSSGGVKCAAEVTIVDVSDGAAGLPGADGVSPTVTVNEDTSLTITDKSGIQTTPILKGADGQSGQMLYATCVTDDQTAAKIATILSGSLNLKTGATVGVKFTYSNTIANPTLNVNGTGGKAIYTQGVPYAYWSAGQTVMFTFDGNYWRVASEPVYTSEVTVGNSAARNLYINGDSVDIKNAGNVLASFGNKKISLGIQANDATIDFCGGQLNIGTHTVNQTNTQSYIVGNTMRIGTSNPNAAGASLKPHLYVNNTSVYAQGAGASGSGVSIDLLNNIPPKSHASSGTDYGVGTTASYGHVKTRNDVNASAYVAGEALSSYQGYALNQKITKNNLGAGVNLFGYTSYRFPSDGYVYLEANYRASHYVQVRLYGYNSANYVILQQTTGSSSAIGNSTATTYVKEGMVISNISTNSTEYNKLLFHALQ